LGANQLDSGLNQLSFGGRHLRVLIGCVHTN
jgi:hypothetical protein